MTDEMNFLAEVSLFSHLKKRDLRRVAKLTRYETFQAGDVIVREGERGGQLLIIVKGQAEVIKGLGGGAEWRLQTLGPRSYFGEMALIDDWVRTASVVAKTEMLVLSLDHWNLRKEIEKDPVISIELLQMLTRRIRVLEKTLTDTLGAFLPLCENCSATYRDRPAPPDKYAGDPLKVELGAGFCEACTKTLYARLYGRD
jgi:CRP-like cAMP-binding protein